MPSPVGDLYAQGLDFVTSIVQQLPDDVWDRPSPCADWRVLDVLGHLGITTRFGIDTLEGRRPAWQPPATPGDAVQGPPQAWWSDLAAHAHRALAGVDLQQTVETPAGPRRIDAGLTFPAVDLYVHGWDMARAAGRDVEIPVEAVQFGRSVLEPIPAEQLRRPVTFGPEVPAPDGATVTAAFLAWTGRDPAWPGPLRA
ncbi:MAG TPA: TIGR03086 family metal-binding protein [Acidimicrobiales bacterium]|nr:TIGR03086 family metal-binding protein [Acidimicrobiales bacterium]